MGTIRYGHLEKREAMQLKRHDKLVRDKIPQIIESNGKRAVFHVLSEAEYMLQLEKKLDEEVAEYHQDKSLEEMADVLDVLYAICKVRGYTLEELEEKRKEKFDERGGFQGRIFLEYVEQ